MPPLERAKTSDSFVYVPGEYERDDKKEVFKIGPPDFRRYIEGWEVIRTIPPYPEPNSYKAVTIETKGTRWPQDYEKFAVEAGIYKFNISLHYLWGEQHPGFTDKDRRVLIETLKTPIDITGHPQADDPGFIDHVRRKELGQLLDIVAYKESSSWFPEDYRRNLYKELLPYYRYAGDKEAFLSDLVDILLEEKIVSSSEYNRIVKKITNAKWGKETSELSNVQEMGKQLMKEVGATDQGNYYTTWYGWKGNWHLYMQYDSDQDKWLADQSSLDDLEDPSSFKMTGTGSAGYNALLEKLHQVNEGTWEPE